MTFSWTALAALGILASALHWLIARAEIMRPFWNAAWLPTGIDKLLRCPACSGFWLGLGLGALGARPLATSHAWLDLAAAGLLGMWITPIAEAGLLWGLDRTKIH